MTEVARFIPSEQRQRTREFESLMYHTEHAIGAAAMSGVLSKQTLRGFHMLTRGFFPPNIRHNRIEIPKSYRSTNTTPVWVSNGYEPFVLGESFLEQTPLQEEYSRRQAVSEFEMGKAELWRYERTFRRETKEGFSDADTPIDPMMPESYALVGGPTHTFNHKAHGDVLRLFRPYMRVRQGLPPHLQGSVLFHEGVHVAQANSRPLYAKSELQDRRLSMEFEAYDHGHGFNNALIASRVDLYASMPRQRLFHLSQEVSRVCDVNPPNRRYIASEAAKFALARTGYTLGL